jgi:MFS family permease
MSNLEVRQGESDAALAAPAAPSTTERTMQVGRYRWVVCALLFTAATVNYVDRQVIGVLKPVLQHDLGYTEIDYGNIVTAFQAAYAIGMLTMGRLMDRLGTRRGFSIAVGFWSLAAMAHAFATTVFGFSVARFALGIGEAGMFPAALKVGLAAAAHQGFSANLLTLSTDMFPTRAVGSAVGIGGMAGAVGGMLIAEAAGHILALTGRYTSLFACAAFAYLVALAVIHALALTLAPVQFEISPPRSS